jgi:hypothetical protein
VAGLEVIAEEGADSKIELENKKIAEKQRKHKVENESLNQKIEGMAMEREDRDSLKMELFNHRMKFA